MAGQAPGLGGDTQPASPSTWGQSRRMSAFETLTWRIEVDPRLRSTITIVDLLDQAPDWQRLVAAMDWGSRTVPRFRQRVVEPALPLGPAVWSTDPDFDLAYHLRRVRLPQPGTDRALLDLAQALATVPFDRQRPPWEATLVEGLDGGRAGFVLKLHHSATDGLGGIQLLGLLHSRTREPDPNKPQPPAESCPPSTPMGVLTQEIARAAWAIPAAAASAALSGVGSTLRAITRPGRTVSDAGRLVRSAQRVLGPPPVPRSPLLAGSSLSRRFEAHEVPLAALKAAARAAAGSVNDAFLAAVLGGLRRYHEHFGVDLATIPIAIPISLRTGDDPMGGNRFAGARLGAPMGERDPLERIRQVRELVLEARDEPAVDALSVVAPVLSRLPGAALGQLIGGMAGGHDVQASNVPGLAHPVYLAGARITRMFPFGPAPGCAVMAAMVSHHGTCCIGITLDTAAVTDPGLFAACLREGFDEILALAPSPGSAPQGEVR